MMQENKLSINCGAACLIRDSQGMFDQVQALNLNCGILLISVAEYTWFYARNMFVYFFLFGLIAACATLARTSAQSAAA